MILSWEFRLKPFFPVVIPEDTSCLSEQWSASMSPGDDSSLCSLSWFSIGKLKVKKESKNAFWFYTLECFLIHWEIILACLPWGMLLGSRFPLTAAVRVGEGPLSPVHRVPPSMKGQHKLQTILCCPDGSLMGQCRGVVTVEEDSSPLWLSMNRLGRLRHSILSFIK